VLATASKPIYAKKTVAEPASIPSTPKGKYLLNEEASIHSVTGIHQRKKKKGSVKEGCIVYPAGSSYPTHPDLNPK